ncbi:unnamed protein product [Tilletia laevis]|uniref:NAD(P)-binding protein n=2 Tax=Tilletia TaxID=13289 RepID=A0A9N8QL37_9BASI|nr:unnamed protein product [Tilletia caries]CAD6957297.1 unnamed protein product [Tilletia laevis]CAD7061052.1 unnamed protein product [Tilletia caries]
MSTVTLPSQAKKQTTVPNKEPITFDFLVEHASKVVLSPKLLALIPLLTYFYDRNYVSASSKDYPFPTLRTIASLLFDAGSAYKGFGTLWAVVALRTAHLALTRYVRNHGHWKPDRPDWARDVVVITGGSAGMGKGVVEVLSHMKKAKIAVLDFSEPTYAPAPTNAPPILFIKTDVSDADAIADAAAKIKEHFGTDPSYILNAAGIASGQTILDTPRAFVEKVYKVNAFSHFLMAQQFLPAMIKRGHGHFLTIASGASYAALPQMGPYACSKAYALAFHEVLQGELRTRYGPNGRKVRNSIFCPTKVATAMGDSMDDHPNPFFTPVLTPVQCSHWLVNVFESGLSQHINAPALAQALPWLRVLPDYGRRAFELVGHTDTSMTASSWNRAVANGYSKNWEK